MRWANFLHIYQPADQQPDILEAVVAQSYRPILQKLQREKHVRLTLNVTGALMELFDKQGYHDLIEIMREVGKEGRIEFTGSAKYHAFLPFLDEKEIIRQIKINDETMRFFLGDAYKPKGFFPPEMAYKEQLAPILEKLGFEWIILDEIAYNGQVEKVDYTKLYTIRNTNLHAFFRERRVSNLIMSATVRSAASLKEAMKNELASDRYLITAMDGETFGHHRPGLENMLFEIFAGPEFDLVTMSDLLKEKGETLITEPIQSTWASSPFDIERGIQFLSWRDPENAIHGWQWELFHLALAEVHALPDTTPTYASLREKMDAALASDHFWWASAKPWWSIEMIEDGAFRLLTILREIPNLSEGKLASAGKLYEQIVSTGFQWQRTGKIRKMFQEQQAILRIPFKDRTLGSPHGEKESDYYAFMNMMAQLEKEAAAKGEYEKAILWRDAQYKVEHKLEIYDAVNAIDLVRLEIPNEKVEAMLDQYKEKYRKIRGGQPEQRGA